MRVVKEIRLENGIIQPISVSVTTMDDLPFVVEDEFQCLDCGHQSPLADMVEYEGEACEWCKGSNLITVPVGAFALLTLEEDDE